MKMLSTGNWQDYRGKGEGVLIHLDTSAKHVLPVREPVDEFGLTVTEPNYETGSYAYLQCTNAKTRLATMKNRRRYFLFGTRYQGLEETNKGKFLIIGYMRLDQILEVRKRHVHKWMEAQQAGVPAPECMDMDLCYAFQSKEMNFYAVEDSFELSEELMKKWGYKGRVTKQMKLSFTEEKLEAILTHFKGKTPKNKEYIAAAKELEEATAAAKEQAAPGAEAW
jgi:predicted DNA-binding WGR domain protein